MFNFLEIIVVGIILALVTGIILTSAIEEFSVEKVNPPIYQGLNN